MIRVHSWVSCIRNARIAIIKRDPQPPEAWAESTVGNDRKWPLEQPIRIAFHCTAFGCQSHLRLDAATARVSH